MRQAFRHAGILAAGATWLGLAPIAFAGPFEDGRAAAQQKDYAAARRLWQPLADAGHAEAQYEIGTLHCQGLGVPRDLVPCHMWINLAVVRSVDPGRRDEIAQEREFVAMTMAPSELAEAQLRAIEWKPAAGSGGQDPADLQRWRTLAEQGDAQAQLRLGLLYIEGEAVPQSHALALAWLRKAADQDVARAQFLLGRAHEWGGGVRKNVAEAVDWYVRAAVQGEPEAQWRLGQLLAEGQGVPINRAQAYKWLSLAAAGAPSPEDRSRNASYRDLLAAEMTPQETAEAERLLRDWAPRQAR